MTGSVLVIYGNILVVVLPMTNLACQQLTGFRIYSRRAFWVCYTIGCIACGLAGLLDGLWVLVALNTVCTMLGIAAAWSHWDDDDDDWPGPKRLARWAKRKLTPRVPVPVEKS